MKLDHYLFLNNISKVQFAEVLKISRAYLHHIISGKLRASKKLASRIEKHSGGKVKVTDIRKDFHIQTPRKKRTTKPKVVQLNAFDGDKKCGC